MTLKNPKPVSFPLRIMEIGSDSGPERASENPQSSSSIVAGGAVAGVLPEAEAFAVHYPGYPSSPSRAVHTLGGISELSKVSRFSFEISVIFGVIWLSILDYRFEAWIPTMSSFASGRRILIPTRPLASAAFRLLSSSRSPSLRILGLRASPPVSLPASSVPIILKVCKSSFVSCP